MASTLFAEMAWMASAVVSGLYVASTALDLLHARYLGSPLYAPTGSPSTYAAIFIALPLFLVSYAKHYWLRSTRINGCKPAASFPHWDPILGLDFMALMTRAVRQTRLIETQQAHFDQLGNTFWFKASGDWMLATAEPENVKAILSTQFNKWPVQGLRQMTSVHSLGPKAIFSVNGKEWQRARALIRPSFVRNQLADLECTNRHVENFLARLPRDGSRVDLQPLFFQFTMDVSTDFMFGRSTNMLVRPTSEALEFIDAFEYTMQRTVNRTRLGRLAFLFPDRKLDSAMESCHYFIDAFISAALTSSGRPKERPYVFMNELVQSGASHDEIRSQLLSMILGGRDTSASTMSSLFWLLARHPRVMAKMREEVKGLQGEKPSWEQLKELKYLNSVIKEVLRLYPPVTSNLRSASEDTILPRGGGPDGQSPLFVPKGTTCKYSMVCMQRRKDIFGPDAQEFRPERWTDGDHGGLRTSWEYVPFSGGPRICIGQQFAITQVAYMVARIVQLFEAVEARDERLMEVVLSTTTILKNGCWVSLKPASN